MLLIWKEKYVYSRNEIILLSWKDNQIEKDGIYALYDALKTNSSLTELVIRGETRNFFNLSLRTIFNMHMYSGDSRVFDAPLTSLNLGGNNERERKKKIKQNQWNDNF